MKLSSQSLNFISQDDQERWIPEHYLWCEVLMDGFRCAVEEKLQAKYPAFLKHRQRIYRDFFATKWLFSDRREIGSFLWICGNLKIIHLIDKIRDAYNKAEFAPELMGERDYRKWRY